MNTTPTFFGALASDLTMTVLFAVIAVMIFTTVVLGSAAFAYRRHNRRKAELWDRLEAKWNRILLEVLSGDRPASDLNLLVQKGEELYFVDYLYRYARRLRGPESEVLARLARPYLKPIVAGVRDGDAERRARAVQTLGALSFDDHAFTIRQALDDPSPLVAMIAARALARPGHARHVGLVLSRLHRFEAWSPRFLSSMIAGMGGDAAPRLREVLGNRSASSVVRTIAADALRKLGDSGAATVAVEVLNEPVERDLHSAVLRLLGKVGRPEDARAVRPLTASSDAVIRAQAVRTLGLLGGESDVDSLRGAVDDSSPWVAIHALRGLREVGRNDLLEELGASTHMRAPVARQVLAEAV